MDSVESSETGKVEVTMTTSDSEDLSDKDSPVQVSHSDAEENVVLITKVMTDKDSSKDNDEETKNVIIHNNVHENKTGNDLSEQVNPSNLNEQPNVNPTEEENIEEEFIESSVSPVTPQDEVIIINNLDESISFKVEVIESDKPNNSTNDERLESHENDNSNKFRNDEEFNPVNPNIPTIEKQLKDNENINLFKSKNNNSTQIPNNNFQRPEEKTQEELKETVSFNNTQLNNEGGSRDLDDIEQELPLNLGNTTGSTKQDDDNSELMKSDHGIIGQEKSSNTEEGRNPMNFDELNTGSVRQSHSTRRSIEIQGDDNPDLKKSEHDIISPNTERDREPMNFGNNEHEQDLGNTTSSTKRSHPEHGKPMVFDDELKDTGSVGQSHSTGRSTEIQDDDNPELIKTEHDIKKSYNTEGNREPMNFGNNEQVLDNTTSSTKRSYPEHDQKKSSNTREDEKPMVFDDELKDTGSVGQSHSTERSTEIQDDDNPELIKTEHDIKKSSNTREDGKPMVFDDEINTDSVGQSHSTRRSTETRDDENPDLKKSEHEMRDQKKSSNKGGERDSTNFEKKEQPDPFNTRSRSTGNPDDDLKKSEHEMKKDQMKSPNKGRERDSTNFEKKEQPDPFNTRSTGQPHSTGNPDDDLKKSEHEMKKDQMKSPNKRRERDSTNFEQPDPFNTSSTGQPHSTGNPDDLKKSEHEMKKDQMKSPNKRRERDSTNFEQPDPFNTSSTGQPHSTGNPDDDLKKSEHEMKKDQMKSPNKGRERDSTNFEKKEQPDLFNTRSTGQPHSTGNPDDDLKKSEHEMKKDQMKSPNKRRERDSTNFEQPDPFNTSSTGQPHSTGNSDDDLKKSEHEMKKDQIKSPNKRRERDSTNFERKEQPDLFNTRSTGQPHSTGNPDDDLKKSEHEMKKDQMKSPNKRRERDSTNFEKKEQPDLFNTRSTGQPHSTGNPDDDLKISEHEMKKDQMKSPNKRRERDSTNFEQPDPFNTSSTGQPHSTGNPDDDLKKSEHEMKKDQMKSPNKRRERDSTNFEKKEQPDLFNTPNTRSSEKPDDHNRSEHEMRENKSSSKDNPDSPDNDKKRITDEEFDLFLKTPILKHDKRSGKTTNKGSDGEETDEEETDGSENDDSYNDYKFSSRNNSDRHIGRSNSQENRVNPEQRNNINEHKDFGWANSQEGGRVDPRQFRVDPNSWEHVSSKNSGSYRGSTYDIPHYPKGPTIPDNNSQGSHRTSMPGSFNSSNTYGPLTDNNGERESLYEGYRKKELQSNSNSGMINRFVSGVSAGMSGVLKFGSNKDDEGVDENIDEIRVIFHVHLPEGIEKNGYPVVLVLNLKLTLNLPSG
ncbi:unnamed protein product [Rhizophagus irregularis]|nr:unnamed protein product [Rhizophagus irregularis]